jgi:hypothetical protein
MPKPGVALPAYGMIAQMHPRPSPFQRSVTQAPSPWHHYNQQGSSTIGTLLHGSPWHAGRQGTQVVRGWQAPSPNMASMQAPIQMNPGIQVSQTQVLVAQPNQFGQQPVITSRTISQSQMHIPDERRSKLPPHLTPVHLIKLAPDGSVSSSSGDRSFLIQTSPAFQERADRGCAVPEKGEFEALKVGIHMGDGKRHHCSGKIYDPTSSLAPSSLAMKTLVFNGMEQGRMLVNVLAGLSLCIPSRNAEADCCAYLVSAPEHYVSSWSLVTQTQTCDLRDDACNRTTQG